MSNEMLTVPCVCCGQTAEADLLEATIPVALKRQIVDYAEEHQLLLNDVVQNALMYYLRLKQQVAEAVTDLAAEDDKPWD